MYQLIAPLAEAGRSSRFNSALRKPISKAGIMDDHRIITDKAQKFVNNIGKKGFISQKSHW
jgi:hypothetical protein